VSAWVTFELFVRPGLRKMLGAATPERPRSKVRLSAAVTRKPGRTEFARARFISGASEPTLELLPNQGSGDLSSIAGVDALVVLPGTGIQLAAGDLAEALVLRPPGG
jgi:molybdopterin biosynthesis enzyme